VLDWAPRLTRGSWPAIALETDRDTRIRFLGAPLGYEAASLVDAIGGLARRF
jgi:hypothetical protein